MRSLGTPRSIAASIEERLLVPTYSSRWPLPHIVAHRSLALPLQLLGPVRRLTMVLGGRSLSVVEAGREKLLRPIASRILGEPLPPVTRPPAPLWSPAALADSGADLVLAEVHRWMAPRFRRAGWLIVPQTVLWRGDLDSVPPRQLGSSLSKNMKRMRKQGFVLEQATDTGDWEEFYTTMVAPQAHARYGTGAWVPSRRMMNQLTCLGTLHLITRGGERVAGVVTVPRGDTLWVAISGVRHGDPQLLHQGASFAILGLTVEWARAQGYRAVDVGRTGPFLNDGLFQYKQGWGFSPAVNPLSQVAAVWVGSDRVRQAFAREPVLVEDGSVLRAYAGE